MISVIERILQNLNIPYNRAYLYDYVERLPLTDSLWAIQKVLNHYGVATAAIRIAEKTKITNCTCPFVAQLSDGLTVVTAVSGGYITFENLRGKHVQSFDGFAKLWSGVALLCQADAESGEPNYKAHRRLQISSDFYRYGIILSAITLLVTLVLLIPTFSCMILAEVICSAIGISLSILLLKKHLKIPGQLAEKLCNIVGHGKCDDVDNIKESKLHLPGNLDLSEIGITFFGINLVALLLFGSAIELPVCLLLILAIPLSIWSIGWQLIHRAWCPLCLMVMGTIWMQLAITLSNTSFILESSTMLKIVALLCFNLLILSAVHCLSKRYMMQQRQKEKINALERAKYCRSIWDTLLGSGEIVRDVRGAGASSLIFGKTDSGLPLITIVGNPFCAPCARMHHRVQPLLDAGFPIQYVYTYFNADLAPVNKQIVASYLRDGAIETWGKLTQWYEGDKFSHPFKVNISKPISSELEKEVIAELIRHDNWVTESGITATPKVLIEGRPLPLYYSIEDLLHIY